MKIGIGSDHIGFELKETIRQYLSERTDVVTDVVDFGAYNTDAVDYPDVAGQLAESVAGGQCDRGILICGTGIGMAIAANKVPGVRAAQVYDPYSAERARKSNDAQIMTLGALVTGKEVAKMLVGLWLVSEFGGGQSARKVGKIDALDARFRAQRDNDGATGVGCGA